VRENVCITMEQGCPHRRPRLVIAVDVVTGPLDRRSAGSAVRRVRSAMMACTPLALPARIELVVASDGRVTNAWSSPPSACLETVLSAVRFDPSAAPSHVRVTLERVIY
jgi:hypothetical protein